MERNIKENEAHAEKSDFKKNLFNPVKLHNFLCYTFFILNNVMMIMAVSLIEFGHSAGAYLLAAILAMISIFNIACFAAVNDDGGV